jgi:hypothetical protein
MEIIETNWGIANTYNDTIKINSKLNQFPELRKKILQHEYEHIEANKRKGLNRFAKNREIDARTEVRFKDILPFIKRYPKALFQQYCPINYSKEENTIYFEWSLIFLYSIFIGIGYGILKLINSFSTTSELSWQITKNIAWIIGIILIIYFIGDRLRKNINKNNWKELDKKRKKTRWEKKLNKLGINPNIQ